MAISKFTPQSAKKDTGRTIGDNEVAKLANLNKMVDQVNAEFASLSPSGGSPTLDIVANGSIGGPILYGWSFNTIIPAGPVTSVSLDVLLCAVINLNGINPLAPVTATSIEFSTLEYAQTFTATNTSTLVNISSPSLKKCLSSLNVTSNSSLTTLNFPLLNYAQTILFGGTPLLTNVNFSSLIEATLQIQTSNSGLTGFRNTMFPALRTAGFRWGSSALAPSFEINFPLLTELIQLQGSATLTNINLPGLVTITNSLQVNIAGLTNLILGTVGVTKNAGSGINWNFSSCGLNQASVDNILQVLASLDGTNGTTLSLNGSVNLTGGTNAIPSSAGLAAKSVLQGRGWTVNTK